MNLDTELWHWGNFAEADFRGDGLPTRHPKPAGWQRDYRAPNQERERTEPPDEERCLFIHATIEAMAADFPLYALLIRRKYRDKGAVNERTVKLARRKLAQMMG